MQINSDPIVCVANRRVNFSWQGTAIPDKYCIFWLGKTLSPLAYSASSSWGGPVLCFLVAYINLWRGGGSHAKTRNNNNKWNGGKLINLKNKHTLQLFLVHAYLALFA